MDLGNCDFYIHRINCRSRRASLVAQSVESACNAGELNSILGSGRPPGEKEMATHSSILSWRIPWTEESGGLQFMGQKESDMTQ